jgi:hypothetical protein
MSAPDGHEKPTGEGCYRQYEESDCYTLEAMVALYSTPVGAVLGCAFLHLR